MNQKNQLNKVALTLLIIVTFGTFIWWAKDTVGEYWNSPTGLIASFSFAISIGLLIFGFLIPIVRKRKISVGFMIGGIVAGIALMICTTTQTEGPIALYLLLPLSKFLFFGGGFLILDKYFLYPAVIKKQKS